MCRTSLLSPYLVFACSTAVFAQVPLPDPSHLTDVQLTIQPVGGQTTFRSGEPILLELQYATTSPETYLISTAGYDRSGRLGVEEFQVSPHAG